MAHGGKLKRRRVLRHRRSLRHISVPFMMLTALLAGCSHEDDGGDEDQASPIDRTSASETAVAYTAAFFMQDIEAARAYVAPASLRTFHYLADVPDWPDTRAEDLSAGNETVEADDATVMLLGTLCKGTGSDEQCITNSDPASTDPTFAVHLTRQDETWSVYYPKPGGHSERG